MSGGPATRSTARHTGAPAIERATGRNSIRRMLADVRRGMGVRLAANRHGMEVADALRAARAAGVPGGRERALPRPGGALPAPVDPLHHRRIRYRLRGAQTVTDRRRHG